MAILDNANNYEIFTLDTIQLNGNGTLPTKGFDVSDADGGFMCLFLITSTLVGGMNVTITLQESPDDTNWTDIPDEKLISTGGDNTIFITSLLLAGDPISAFGAFSTEKFIRALIVVANFGADTPLNIVVLKNPELTPASL